LLRMPQLSLRWLPVWRRNLLVWRKLAIASVLGNIADPLLYMLALGYGIGSFIPEIGGMKYIAFIGTGMVCQSAMFTASFEGMYSAFSRMHVQRTWDGIINAPIAQMPAALASIANVLPLKHAIHIARPLMMGRVPTDILTHIAVLAAYAVVAYYVALALTRRRLLK